MSERLPLNPDAQRLDPPQGLASYPAVEKWDDWVEYDTAQWPRKVEKHCRIIPTICFNCEAGCGLVAVVEKDTHRIRRFEGNPEHPGSRGRNCAKGPATLNQVSDPERIRYPLKRVGRRGEGKWERVSWDEVLDDIAGRVRKALQEERRNEIMYHVGRPGHELLYHQRILHSWGIDGHNSHTNVCSAGARAGYAFWSGIDRPSPDHANARFILLLSSHLETGHYFNPHAQRIIEAKEAGTKIAVMDTRLSNTASKADYWMSTWPGSEAAVLLAMCNVLLQEELFDRNFLRHWVNWEEYLREEHSDKPPTFQTFVSILKETYGQYTPEFAAKEAGIEPGVIVEVAHEIAKAGSAFSSHVWRNTAAGNLGGWQVARALQFLVVLVGAVGTVGGTAPNAANKYIPTPPLMPPPSKIWNELLIPKEFPLAFFEMSFLLPHFVKEGRGKLAMYFTRVYNPVWTNPDGMCWIEMLSDESKVERHACLTPTWSETAWFADYVLPMGHASERHDLMSQETQAARWIGFRQPVLRVALEKQGQKFSTTYEAHEAAGIGQVWEEDEFWIELSWRVDPDGSLGIRKYFESPYESGKKMTVDDYYRWIFENSVPGLPAAAAQQGITALEYMRKYGAFLIEDNVYKVHEAALKASDIADASVDGLTKLVFKNGVVLGVEVDGKACVGFPTPSRKLEFFSKTLRDWQWPEHAIPGYIKSQVHPDNIDLAAGEMLLLPTFRLPTLIHTRSGNAKWLYEISNRNPLWLNSKDAENFDVKTGDLLKVHTEIGYFIDKVWVTEGIKPGVVACSHHLGRWRLAEEQGGERWSTALVDLKQLGEGKWMMRTIHGIQPFKSDDPDSSRIFWQDGGVHQNLTFPVQPDFISGQHCWHQKVRITQPGPDDRYGDVFVDTHKSHEVYKKWLLKTRPAPGPGNLRRPYWLPRSYKPALEAYYF